MPKWVGSSIIFNDSAEKEAETEVALLSNFSSWMVTYMYICVSDQHLDQSAPDHVCHSFAEGDADLDVLGAGQSWDLLLVGPQPAYVGPSLVSYSTPKALCLMYQDFLHEQDVDRGGSGWFLPPFSCA